MKRETDGYTVSVYFPANARGHIDFVRRDAEELQAQIKRHCDVPYGHSVNLTADTREVCEHCGHAWTETGKLYNGGCCDADEEAMEARLVATRASA